MSRVWLLKLFDTLAKKNINVDVILQSIGRAGRKGYFFHSRMEMMLDDAVQFWMQIRQDLDLQSFILREILRSFLS